MMKITDIIEDTKDMGFRCNAPARARDEKGCSMSRATKLEDTGCEVISDGGPNHVCCTHCDNHMNCWCYRVSVSEYNRLMGIPTGKVIQLPFGPFGRKAPYVEPPQTLAPSPIEGQFWSAYRKLNPRELRGLTPQYKVGPYRIDFALPRYKFAIELDGFRDHSSTADIARDRARERFLQYHGWFIIRFGGAEVYQDAERCVREADMLFKTWKRHR